MTTHWTKDNLPSLAKPVSAHDTFELPRSGIKGSVIHIYLELDGDLLNDAILIAMGYTDKPARVAYCEKLYGYRPGRPDMAACPEYNSGDMQAATKLLLAYFAHEGVTAAPAQPTIRAERPFFPGDIVQCVKGSGSGYRLTKGKEYTVVCMSSGKEASTSDNACVRVVGDDGAHVEPYVWRFKLVRPAPGTAPKPLTAKERRAAAAQAKRDAKAKEKAEATRRAALTPGQRALEDAAKVMADAKAIRDAEEAKERAEAAAKAEEARKAAEAKAERLKRAQASILPAGDLIGWKKLASSAIAELLIPKAARRSNATGKRKCRAEYAEVVAITSADGKALKEATNRADGQALTMTYTVGKRVTPDSFDINPEAECAPGIHFFITREEAEAYAG